MAGIGGTQRAIGTANGSATYSYYQRQTSPLDYSKDVMFPVFRKSPFAPESAGGYPGMMGEFQRIPGATAITDTLPGAVCQRHKDFDVSFSRGNTKPVQKRIPVPHMIAVDTNTGIPTIVYDQEMQLTSSTVYTDAMNFPTDDEIDWVFAPWMVGMDVTQSQDMIAARGNLQTENDQRLIDIARRKISVDMSFLPIVGWGLNEIRSYAYMYYSAGSLTGQYPTFTEHPWLFYGKNGSTASITVNDVFDLDMLWYIQSYISSYEETVMPVSAEGTSGHGLIHIWLPSDTYYRLWQKLVTQGVAGASTPGILQMLLAGKGTSGDGNFIISPNGNYIQIFGFLICNMFYMPRRLLDLSSTAVNTTVGNASVGQITWASDTTDYGAGAQAASANPWAAGIYHYAVIAGSGAFHVGDNNRMTFVDANETQFGQRAPRALKACSAMRRTDISPATGTTGSTRNRTSFVLKYYEPNPIAANMYS